MSTRFHHMPFGAEMLQGGGVRFRLWAPSAQSVDLCLLPEGDPLPAASDRKWERLPEGCDVLPMKPEPEGWFNLETSRAGAGSLYHFRIDQGSLVPDPASRFQPFDVHGPSRVVDPARWQWRDDQWKGRPWEEVVLYELHLGTFTPGGTLSAALQRLDFLVELGVTAIELMPIADFPGRWNWGYDGTYLFAPESLYGSPDELKEFIQKAHLKGLAVILDVVYNHFGPEGNYLHLYARPFFQSRRTTPWGAALNFDGRGSKWVRRFFIENALYWLQEYHFDGLRLDAVHAISDRSGRHILEELADTVRGRLGSSRHLHLILENDRNEAHFLERRANGTPRWFTAQWNDDLHHALHHLITGETAGYYADFVSRPREHLGRSLTQGFSFQGQPSPFRGNRPRGQKSTHLPPQSFIGLLQNHDQVGNRAWGERIFRLASPERIRTALALVLLAPSPPLLFMGQEWAAGSPFLFFCDFEKALAQKITRGRRNEFAQFPQFSDPAARRRIPDPSSQDTFQRSRLPWPELDEPEHRGWLEYHRHLLQIRRRWIVPFLSRIRPGWGRFRVYRSGLLRASWRDREGRRLTLIVNLREGARPRTTLPRGRLLFSNLKRLKPTQRRATCPAWSVAFFLEMEGAAP